MIGSMHRWRAMRASILADHRRVRPALERFVASLDAQQRAEVEGWLSHRRGFRSWRRG